jgi:hypothetical protein
MVTNPAGLGPHERQYRPVLSAWRTNHKKKTKIFFKYIPWNSKKNWSLFPDGGQILGQTGRLTVDREITSAEVHFSEACDETVFLNGV